MALLGEVVFETNRLLLWAHSPKGTRLPNPLHIPRPGETPKRPATRQELRSALGKLGIPIHRSKKKENPIDDERNDDGG